MKAPLLKGNNFSQNYEQLVLRIQSLRRKNDQYQKLNSQQIDQYIALQVIDQKSLMDNQIKQTKKMLEQMDTIYKQPPQRNKLKQMRKQYEKQVSRYKQISQALMEKSVIRAELRSTIKKASQHRNSRQTRQSIERYHNNKPNRVSQHIAKEQQLDMDYSFQHKILMERKDQLGKVQKQFHLINQIHNDQQRLVYEQGDKIDAITSQMLKAQQNVQGVNSQLQQAMVHQKKSRKKIFCIIIIIIFIIIIALGVAYILFNPNN